MIEYRITVHDDKILKTMWSESRQLIQIINGKMYWSKQIKKTVTKKNHEPTKEFLEFRERYNTIKKNWLYDQSLIKNYNECVSKWLHKDIMANLESYITYLEVTDKKDYALMATTYINRKRYLDEWVVVKDLSRKRIDDLFKQRELNPDVISNVLTEIDAREAKNKTK